MMERGFTGAHAVFEAGFPRSSRTARWSGISVASGGVVFVVAAFFSFALMVGWLAPITPGYEMFAEAYAAKRFLNMSYALTAPLGAFFVSVGMLGVLPILAMRPGARNTTMKAGTSLAITSSVCAAAFTVYEFMPRYFERDPTEFVASQSAYGASFLGWMCGVSLAGVAALRVRSLGRWRLLLAPLAALCLPARHAVLLVAYLSGFSTMTDPGFVLAALLEAPMAIGGVGWVFFGLALSKAHEKELETTRKENLAIARRFYEGAWSGGNLDIADSILAPEFVDLRHGTEGPTNFKNYLADLRATFPDLRIAIHSQTAVGDEVETRCELHGTDKGGVLFHPPTNKKVHFSATFTDEMHDGLITVHRGEVDEDALLEQLGHKDRESGATR